MNDIVYTCITSLGMRAQACCGGSLDGFAVPWGCSCWQEQRGKQHLSMMMVIIMAPMHNTSMAELIHGWGVV